MIIISRTRNNQYKVQYTGKNNQILSNSETLKTKKSAWKNIYASALIFCWTVTNPIIELEIKVWDKTIVGSKPFGYSLGGIKKKSGVRK